MNCERTTELRLALAMRGGVSLAIWIGGACAEIDRLRRADATPEDEPDRFWADLLEESRYSSVIVDVIAGASAGGLNGVLFATSQHYGFSLDDVRGLWLELGGLHDLVRCDDPRLSLLDGDKRFLLPLQDRLRELAAQGERSGCPPRVDLQLSATLVEPITRPARSPVDEALTEQRFASRFQFRCQPGAPWRRGDFPERPGGPDDASDLDAALDAAAWRWALAARATSSFPGAFEPAVVRATRPCSFGERADDAAQPTVDMRGVFADLRGGGRTGVDLDPDDFVVADGGILDNIPLGKALSAIADAPADAPTDRYLVYLHPNGPATGDVAAKPAVSEGDRDDGGAAVIAERTYRRSAVSVLGGALGARQWTETTVGDIEQLDAHNEAVGRADAIRRGTCARIDALSVAGDRLPQLAAALTSQYTAQRSMRDATIVRALLDDPLGVIGEDEFPRRVLGPDGQLDVGDDRWRSPLTSWTPSDREGLTTGLAGEFHARVDPPEPEAIFRAGTGPLERVLRLLIEWARSLDRPGLTVPAGTDDPGECRRRLYATLLFVRDALARTRDLGWVTYGATRNLGDVGGWDAGAAVSAVDALVCDDDEAVAEVCAAVRATGGPGDDDTSPCSLPPHHRRALRAFEQRSMTRLGALPGDAGRDAGGPTDLRTALLSRIVAPIASGLAATHLARGPELASQVVPVAPDRLFDHLAAALDHPEDGDHESPARTQAVIAVLAALEIVCYEEFVSGVGGSRITLTRVSAANRTPLASAFDALRSGPGPEWVPTRGGPAGAEGLHPKRKLAGNELNNFAAFVRPEWRANDWMWGRLDAVPTLVDLLVTPDSVLRSLRCRRIGSLEDARTWIRDMVTSGSVAGGDTEEWQTFLATEVWAPRSSAIGAELDALLAHVPTDDDATGAARGRAALRVDAIRDALIARRQWEILADELAQPTDPNGSRAAPLSPSCTREKARTHRVGLDTLREPRDPATVDLFHDISDAAGQALVGNVTAVRDRGQPGREPDGLDRLTRIGGAAVQRIGRIVVDLALAPGSTLLGRRTLWAILIGLVAIGAMVWALATDWQVAVVGLVIGIALVLAPLISFAILRRPGRR